MGNAYIILRVIAASLKAIIITAVPDEICIVTLGDLNCSTPRVRNHAGWEVLRKV